MCIITGTAIATATGISIGIANALAVAGNVALAVGTVASIGGSIMGGISSYQQGKQQQAMYNYQAQVNQENAKIAQQNARETRQQGLEEERLQRMKTLQNIGSQQAAMAANGIDVTQGTPLDVIEDTAAIGELDALQTRYNFEKKALAFDQTANEYQNQANLDIISGKNAYEAGKWGAVAHGLEGLGKIGDVASKWYGFSGNELNEGISWGKTASGFKVGTDANNKLYASRLSGLN